MYLNVENKDSIYTCIGPEFELVGIVVSGTLLEFIKTVYGFTTSGNIWHMNLLYNFRGICLNTTHFNPNVRIEEREGGHDNISTNTNDVLVVSK